MANLKELQAAAKELNKVLGCNPPINIKGDEKVITAGIKTSLDLIDEDEDEFTEATQLVIDGLKASVKPGKKGKVEPEPEEDEEEVEVEDEEEVETEEDEEEDLSLIDEIKAVKGKEGMSNLKVIIKTNAEFKKFQATIAKYKTMEELKSAMLSLLGEKESVKPGDKKAPAAEDKPKGKFGHPNAQCTLADKINFFTPLIKAGNQTQKELIEVGMEHWPHLTKSSLQTFLTDSKNAKYNKFAKLVVLDGKGNMTFTKK